jgi:hypothetical protein
MSICLSMSMSIYVYLCVSMSIYVYLCVSMSIYVYLCLSMSIYVYLCVFVYMYVLCICVYVYGIRTIVVLNFAYERSRCEQEGDLYVQLVALVLRRLVYVVRAGVGACIYIECNVTV